jgi:hypothetical protein
MRGAGVRAQVLLRPLHPSPDLRGLGTVRTTVTRQGSPCGSCEVTAVLSHSGAEQLALTTGLAHDRSSSPAVEHRCGRRRRAAMTSVGLGADDVRVLPKAALCLCGPLGEPAATLAL